jgi:hypothetical protein
VALSIAAFEPSWYVADLLENVITHARADTRILLHYNCQGESSSPLSALAAPLLERVELNPRCVTVRKFCGSILHAHLLNFQFLEASGTRSDLLPRFFVMQASNQRWIGPGWELHALSRAASVNGSVSDESIQPRHLCDSPCHRRLRFSLVQTYVSSNPFKMLSPREQVNFEVIDGTLEQLAGGKNVPCFTYAEHEGAFYPAESVRRFIPALARALRRASGGRHVEGADEGAALSVLDSSRGAFEEYAMSTFHMVDSVHRQGMDLAPAANRRNRPAGRRAAALAGSACSRQRERVGRCRKIDLVTTSPSCPDNLARIGYVLKPGTKQSIEDLVASMRSLHRRGLYAIKPVQRKRDDVMIAAVRLLDGRTGAPA